MTHCRVTKYAIKGEEWWKQGSLWKQDFVQKYQMADDESAYSSFGDFELPDKVKNALVFAL